MKTQTIEDVQPMVVRYQATPNDELLKEIIGKIAPYIRNYPHFAFRKNDDDIKSDFFLYVYERFDGFLAKYNPELSSFTTYLSIKLKNHFLNYLRREKTKNKIKVVSYEMDSVNEAIFQESNVSWKIAEEAKLNLRASEIEDDVFSKSKKNTFRYLCLKLYYFDFFSEEDFVALKEFTKKKYSVLLKEINDFAEEIARKKRNKMEHEFRLNKIHHSIIKTNEEAEKTGEDISEQLKNLNHKKDDILKKYNAVSVRPTMRAVGILLNVETSKVQNIINYFKNNLRTQDRR